MSVNLIPAYGRIRSINTAQQAKDSWLVGEDWKFKGGPYTSIRDRDQLLKQDALDDLMLGPVRILLTYVTVLGTPQTVDVTDLREED